MREFLVELLDGWGVADPVAVALISALPVVELRGGIPFGRLVLQMGSLSTWIWAVAGNLAPLPLVFWLLGVVDRYCTPHRLAWLRRLLDGLYAHTRRRHSARFVRLRDLALLMVVAIPLPLTGGWSGVLAAYVFDIPLRRASWLIGTGVAVAGTAVLALVDAGLLIWN